MLSLVRGRRPSWVAGGRARMLGGILRHGWRGLLLGVLSPERRRRSRRKGCRGGRSVCGVILLLLLLLLLLLCVLGIRPGAGIRRLLNWGRDRTWQSEMFASNGTCKGLRGEKETTLHPDPEPLKLKSATLHPKP